MLVLLDAGTVFYDPGPPLASTTVTPPPNHIFAEKYELLGMLGRGAMGIVHRAKNIHTEREVALKRLFPHVPQSVVGQFQQEARIFARAESNNIVEILDAGIDNSTGEFYLVMELLCGKNLEECVQEKPFSPAETLEILEQVANALDKVHSHKKDGKPAPIVHCDLKPANLFLTRRADGTPWVKVLDFGIAKVLSATTNQSQGQGTPLFMAFEQASGKPISPQTDIWALGLIAFSLMSGKFYWKTAQISGANSVALGIEIIQGPLDPPSERLRSFGQNPPWPLGFDNWFLQCVNRNPLERFQSASKAIQALQQALVFPPATSGPISSSHNPISLSADLALQLLSTQGMKSQFFHGTNLNAHFIQSDQIILVGEGAICLLNLNSKKVIWKVLAPVVSCSHSSTKNILAVGLNKGKILLLDGSSGAELTTFESSRAPTMSLAFSPDGSRLASGNSGGAVCFWDVSSGRLQSSFHAHFGAVTSIAFNPDGRTLASGSDDNFIRLWEVPSNKLLAILEAHTDWVKSVAFSPTGHTLASCSNDTTVRLWEVPTGKLLASLEAHTSSVKSVAFSPDGLILASGSRDTTVRLWEVSSRKLITSFEAHTDWVESVTFSPDGRTLASGSRDTTVRLWEVPSGKLLTSLTASTGGMRSATFSPDGRILAFGSHKTVYLWEISSGKPITSLKAHTDWVRGVAFSPDGHMLASGSDDKTVLLWDVSSSKLPAPLKHSDWVRCVAFTHDGRVLASGSDDTTIRLWEVPTGKLLASLEARASSVKSVAFSPDGLILASGNSDNKVRLWGVSSRRLLASLEAHVGSVTSVAFSKNGLILASGHDSGCVCLWTLPSGRCISTIQGHGGEVEGLYFAPDGLLYTWDSVVRAWDISNFL